MEDEKDKRLFQAAEIDAAVRKGIGAINGKWAILFKAQLATQVFLIPTVLAWGIWATVAIFEIRSDIAAFIAVGPRYTPAMARGDHLELIQQIHNDMEQKYPPQWLRDTIESQGRRIEALEKE